jgi:7-cyano-7-deazaguanine tRNA-ribosyltransferase
LTFEIKKHDLRGRIGRIRTKSGSIETPLFFPVINPLIQLVPPRKLWEEFGFEAVMANAYLVKKNFEDRIKGRTIHELLDFPGVVMTDSGAYQILTYGEVPVTPREILVFQEEISTDIGVILDQPTSWRVSWSEARRTVETTLERAEEALRIVGEKGIQWTGPVQGGICLDLVEFSAKKMSELPFDLYALGSPTTLMQNYWFSDLIEMIVTANSHLPVEKPMHLFGAGHPLFFSFAVALGCDMFDSAAYAIYARQGRYMTEQGTVRVSRLKYFPCSCPICSSLSPKELGNLPNEEAQVMLAKHNLYSCMAEIRRIKQAIEDGRLWELLEIRSRSHPALLNAFKRFKTYERFLESRSPISKSRGFFHLGSTGLHRPEIVRHTRRIADNYKPPLDKGKILLLISQSRRRPFHRSPEAKKILDGLYRKLGDLRNRVHVCFFASPFGIVPLELDEVYPLSQHQSVIPCDNDRKVWGEGVSQKCREACEAVGIPLITEVEEKDEINKDRLEHLSSMFVKILSESS